MRILIAALAMSNATSSVGAAPIDDLLAVGPEGKGNAAATQAWAEITRTTDVATLLDLLEAMDNANPIAANWLRSAAEVIAEGLPDGGKAAVEPLDAFLRDLSHSHRARRFAFELIRNAAPAKAEAIIPGMLKDPSPELRYDAVARVIREARRLTKDGKQEQATQTYKEALGGAVEPGQVTAISDALKELGTEVDLPKHFGFLMRWHVIGPFDNTERAGFAKAYPPESAINLSATYKGKTGEIKWQPLASSHRFGKIDLNKPFGMLKETVAYAYTEFESDEARPAELRLGTKNAWKIWLNGDLVFAREEYHRGQRIDQYQLPVQLKAGKNTILVKACQDEQMEEWSVHWEFQLRVCDSTGTAILASNRLPTPKPEATGRRPRRPKKP